MGTGITFKFTNNYTMPFFCISSVDPPNPYTGCMYDMENLATIPWIDPVQKSSLYVETKASGWCYFQSSFFLNSYASTPHPPWTAQFFLGMVTSGTFPQMAGYNMVSMSGFGVPVTIYLWTAPGNVAVTLDSVGLDTQGNVIVDLTIPAPGQMGQKAHEELTAPPRASFQKFGSDYNGPPKDSVGPITL